MGCPVTISCGSPIDGSVGIPYTHTFPTTGGPNLFFSISSGALPPGLTLDPATGKVTGTPTTGGSYAFTIKVTDAQILATGDDGSFSDFQICIASDDASTWSKVTTAISDSGWSVAYSTVFAEWLEGADLPGSSTALQSSPDGVSGNWTGVSSPAGSGWVRRILSGENSAVALYGFSGAVMYTTDGSTWTTATIPSGVSINGSADIAYSPDLGRFVIMDCTGPSSFGVLTSDDDGITWVFHATPESVPVLGLAWGNGLFVGIGGPQGSGDHLITSPDGFTWTVQANPGGSSQGWDAIGFGNGRFVIVSGDTATNPGNQAAYSTDGLTWTIVATPGAGKKWACVTYGYGYWLAGENASQNTTPLMRSNDDGATWSIVTLGFNFGFITGIAFGPVDNCSDTANCTINIGGVTLGNTWRGGFQQRIGNTFG